MQKLVLKLWSVILVAARRLRSQGGLTLAAAVGLMILIALVMSIPSFADAVSYRVLSARLLEETPLRSIPDFPRPPFIFLFQYTGPYRGSPQWEQVKPVDAYLSGPVIADLGLPEKWKVRVLKSYPFKLFSPQDADLAEPGNAFTWASFTTLSDLEMHISVIEGTYPSVTAPTPGGAVEVLVSEALATYRGLSAGETYVAYNQDSEEIVKIPVRITGIWRAKDPQESYWLFPPGELQDDLLVPEATLLDGLAPAIQDELGQGMWALALDSSSIHAGDSARLVSRIARVEMQAGNLLTGMYLKESPTKMLLEYQRTTNLLSFLLAAFSVPIAALFLAYINLVGGVIIERQRNEIAMLRSRGATLIQVAGITALEGVLLVGVALVLGIPLSKGILLLMGKTRSFLDFALPASLRLDVPAASLAFGGCAALLVLAARVLLVLGAARHTIVTYKQERARAMRPPWWQRAWLDVLLFIPAVYGAYLLRQQGSVVLPGSTANDPFQNPLLLLAPALGIFAVTLFLLRLLPGIMAGLAWVASQTNSVGLLMASRHLSRTPGFYAAPFLLLVLTLSLSAFTASLAQTLDNHYRDQQYYVRGADINLAELGQCLKFDPLGNCNANASTETEPTWAFLPVSEHLKVPGVQAAARVGFWTARASMGGDSRAGAFIGIDRLDFPKVAFWRKDFAPSSLGALMNALAAAPDGVLVSQAYLEQEVLYVGDTLALNVDIAGKTHAFPLKIVGSFDLFPTWYPDTGPLFVGNLDYFFEQMQGQHPYNVWLKTAPQAGCAQIVNVLRDPQRLGLDVQGCSSSRENILKEQKRPEHQGLFGLLSVGFIGAALLTVLGFLLYALFSFQRRFIEMGVLRAIGLSSSQMISLLAWELGFLIATGLAAGTFLGVLVSNLFIPYLQIGAKNTAHIPAFIVEIAWGRIFLIYILFGLLFIIALGGLAWLLMKMKIFQAIKLGETA